MGLVPTVARSKPSPIRLHLNELPKGKPSININQVKGNAVNTYASILLFESIGVG